MSVHLPPKLNGSKIRHGSTVSLRSNDVISISGRDFIFRKGDSYILFDMKVELQALILLHIPPFVLMIVVSQGEDSNDVENKSTVAKESSLMSPNKASKRATAALRCFGKELSENISRNLDLQPLKLEVQTNMIRDRDGNYKSPLHSFSSTSSYSISDTDNPHSPDYLRVMPSSDGVPFPDHSGDKFPVKCNKITPNANENDKHNITKTEKHVHFTPNNNLDEDDEDDDDMFFDIIAEADRLLLNNEDKLAVDVNYNRIDLEVEGTSDVVEKPNVTGGNNCAQSSDITEIRKETESSECGKNYDVVEPTPPTTPMWSFPENFVEQNIADSSPTPDGATLDYNKCYSGDDSSKHCNGDCKDPSLSPVSCTAETGRSLFEIASNCNSVGPSEQWRGTDDVTRNVEPVTYPVVVLPPISKNNSPNSSYLGNIIRILFSLSTFSPSKLKNMFDGKQGKVEFEEKDEELGNLRNSSNIASSSNPFQNQIHDDSLVNSFRYLCRAWRGLF